MPLPFKPFEHMTEQDYAAIGFRCGLEVHRQILTQTKLFCRCPAGRYSSEYDAEVLRHMRPTLSELGEYDGTALMEKKTRKNIYYRLHRDTVCTYEFDDTPPFFLNDEALSIALEIALLLRLNMVDELHIARKQYLDGSIPTGFQRTTIVGVDGWMPYKDRRVRIRQLGLEEDSCREVSDVGHDRVYLTDRLGMPLIEVVTEPDMVNPQEVYEVGQIIRRLCRSTGKVRTGYGAVRQDVNVSVTGGTRIEIKGVPQLWRIPRLVYNEARRQCSLLHIRDQLAQRGVTPENLSTDHADVTRIVAKTSYVPIQSAVSAGERVRCVALRRFAGLLNEPTQEHTTFAKEFSDRVRVIACLTRLPNIAHSDTASETLLVRDWQRLFKALDADPGDALMLVWGPERDTITACEEIMIRAREATQGIPPDTRQALKDGTNGFERVLPGAERMYPDTDLPPLKVDEKQLESIRGHMPEFVWDREARYRQLGLTDALIDALIMSDYAEVFDRAVGEHHVPPVFAAVVLTQRLKALRRSGLDVRLLSEKDLLDVLAMVAQARLAPEGVFSVLRQVVEARSGEKGAYENGAAVNDIVANLGSAPSEAEVASGVRDAIAQSVGRSFPSEEHRRRFVMGQLMRSWRGLVGGRELSRKVQPVLMETGVRIAAAGGSRAAATKTKA
ncbi:MAG: Glu-tRNA(Gln) amidotransferase subunit GatE [Phycisphaerae bacterium]|nr:Glu-tRNA(Gln) amidotransferase subunit GatE [Phycisphaerae bacterium]